MPEEKDDSISKGERVGNLLGHFLAAIWLWLVNNPLEDVPHRKLWGFLILVGGCAIITFLGVCIWYFGWVWQPPVFQEYHIPIDSGKQSFLATTLRRGFSLSPLSPTQGG